MKEMSAVISCPIGITCEKSFPPPVEACMAEYNREQAWEDQQTKIECFTNIGCEGGLQSRNKSNEWKFPFTALTIPPSCLHGNKDNKN